MGGVFDRLNNKLGSDDSSGGISPIELAKLPPVQRQLMRLLLRELEMSEATLREEVSGWGEDKRPTEPELDEALKDMIQDGWVIKMGEGAVITYKANLRRKAPSTLAKTLWASLDKKIEEQKGDPPVTATPAAEETKPEAPKLEAEGSTSTATAPASGTAESKPADTATTDKPADSNPSNSGTPAETDKKE